MGHMTLISEYFNDKRDNSSILAKSEHLTVAIDKI